MKNKYIIFSACRGNIEDSQLVKSLTEILKINPTVSTKFKSNNTLGLSRVYNNFIKYDASNNDVAIFVHDDVYIDDFRIFSKLDEAHSRFDIVGLAGGIGPRISTPALWHLMCGGVTGGNLRGAVSHPYNKEQLAMTSFGPTPSRVAILDGLFLSIKLRSIRSCGWRFNENYNFHHYDIASCIDANNKKLRLGVWPIWVTHTSPGLLNPNDKDFNSSQTRFLKEYAR